MHDNDAKKLRETMKDIGEAMLVTLDAQGAPRGRPMAVARVEEDGEVWFVTSIEDGKVDEIERTPRVGVMMQGKRKYASVTGRARVVRDRGKIDELWQESWRVWFSEGKEDPSISLLAVTPERGEYWDVSGSKGARYLWEAAKAVVTGRDIDGKKAGDHGKVSM